MEAEKEEAAKRSALLEGDLQAFLATADAENGGGADGAMVSIRLRIGGFHFEFPLTLTLTLLTLTLTRVQTGSFMNWRVSFRIFTNPNPNPGEAPGGHHGGARGVPATAGRAGRREGGAGDGEGGARGVAGRAAGGGGDAPTAAQHHPGACVRIRRLAERRAEGVCVYEKEAWVVRAVGVGVFGALPHE